MAAVLPSFPRFVFTVLEPISLIAGAFGPLLAPSFFVASQLAENPPHVLNSTEHILALQLGNAYLLLALLGIAILNTTRDSSVVKSYIWALWVADIGHVGVTVWAMGMDKALDVLNWNAVTFGNIGVTLSLFLVRTLYLLGWFGLDRISQTSGKTVIEAKRDL